MWKLAVIILALIGFLVNPVITKADCTEWTCFDQYDDAGNFLGSSCSCTGTWVSTSENCVSPAFCSSGYVCNTNSTSGCWKCCGTGPSGTCKRPCSEDGGATDGLILTEITKTATSVNVTWTGGNANTCGNKYYYMVYLGTDFNAVNGNCGDIGHNTVDTPLNNFDYQGEGSRLPYGCTAVRQIGTGALSSFDSSAYGITLMPGTTYYIKVDYRKSYDDADGLADMSCSTLGPIAFLNACTINPASADLAVDGGPVEFTTDAYVPNGVPVFTPTVSSVTYQPYYCEQKCDKFDECWCKVEYPERYDITGNFGQTFNSPQMEIKYNNQRIYRAQISGGTSVSIPTSSLSPKPPNGSLTPSNVHIWYPTPAYPLVKSVDVPRSCEKCDNESVCKPCNCSACNSTASLNGINISGSQFGSGGKIHINIFAQTNYITPKLSKDYTVPANEVIYISDAEMQAAGFSYIPAYAVTNYSPPYFVEASYTSQSNVPDLSVYPNTIASVGYSEWPSPGGYIAINPASSTDKNNKWPTNVTAVQQSSSPTNLRADVYAEEVSSPPAARCQSQITTNGTSDPWWQVKDSDIQSHGDLISSVPSGKVFDDIGLGGFPGVPASTNAPNFGSGSVSATSWLTQSSWLNPKKFDYDYFANLIPSDTLSKVVSINDENGINGAETSLGYEWYKYDGAAHGGIALSINNSINLNGRKVILLVDSADLNIGPGTSINVGGGFFLVLVKGNISVDLTVGGGVNPDLEGIYEADGTFSDGTGGASDDVPLYVRGSIVAYGGVSLNRVLSNNSSPAELFEYAPDQIMQFPAVLGYRKLNWKEVAP